MNGEGPSIRLRLALYFGVVSVASMATVMMTDLFGIPLTHILLPCLSATLT